MVKLAELRRADDITAAGVRDPVVRYECERTRFANAITTRVIDYPGRSTGIGRG